MWFLPGDFTLVSAGVGLDVSVGSPKGQNAESFTVRGGFFRSCSSSPENSFSSLEENPLMFLRQVRFKFLFSSGSGANCFCLFPSFLVS